MDMDIVKRFRNGKVRVTHSRSACFLIIAHLNANAWLHDSCRNFYEGNQSQATIA
jgi:hypothetical protein